ncbi:hypothetical protein M0R45_013825 [Rubus argutus]|uniref:Endonuclease/exonuclease/phosphatase domain-containing protein n=1 Tax=Rubus argutus TaxID=59490 RepID=A0AAW1XN23_RUBAR
MFKIMCWNVRGAGGKNFRNSISDLIKMNHLDVVVICEPKVSFCDKQRKFFKNLGFPDAEISKANGFSGGIWLLWDKRKIDIYFIDNNVQAITVKITGPLSHPWIFSALYASPTATIRNTLWDYLDGLSSSLNLPWMIAGDFNELICCADRNFGPVIRNGGRLKDWIHRKALIDMGFIGSKFTWTNNRIKERLDRAFCNDEWRMLYPEAFVQHLPRMKSDHCPIIIQLFSNTSLNRLACPFRFQAMWLQHADFSNLVSNTWKNCSGNFLAKTKTLTAALKNWNDNVFGNIFKRKRKLLNRLAGIQNCMDRGTNPFLLNLEAGIIKEYEELRDQEAIFWHQKSRDQWLKDGDRNTKFFHLTTLIQRRRNKIEGLFDDNDVWTTDCTSMKTIAINYFSRLFTFEASLDTLFHIPNLFPDLEAQKISWIQRPLSRAEVNMAMFSIGGTKTPGPDGYPAIFYQKHWGIYGDKIFQIVNEAFNSGVVPAGLNHTLITLIPKTT